jgi:polyphenol oxidase
MTILADTEIVDEFAPFGIRAFTTTRAAGSFGLGGTEPVGEVMSRWVRLREELRDDGSRLAHATQVHGNRVIVHGAGWEGWLRVDAADGHVAIDRGLVLAVTVADCVPVFIAHPSGAVGLLHSGWRGTASRIVEHGIEALAHRGFRASELRIHLGPSICGSCYEVGADVLRQLTGRPAAGRAKTDLRALIAAQAHRAGVQHVSTSHLCTRCDNDRFFSHRAGDSGRQLAVIAAAKASP